MKSSSPPPTPAVISKSSTMRFEASFAVESISKCYKWSVLEKYLPGVFKSLLCGTWNCIVFGGLPKALSSSSSNSSSLSQIPFFVSSLGFAGVKTETPGVLDLPFAGDEKISACNCGAAGISGLDDKVESKSLVLADVAGVVVALAASQLLPFVW